MPAPSRRSLRGSALPAGLATEDFTGGGRAGVFLGFAATLGRGGRWERMSAPISREGSMRVVPAAPAKVAAPQKEVHPSEGPTPFARMLKGLGNEVERGERLV